MGFMDGFLGMFGDRQLPAQKIDIRTPQQVAVQNQMMGDYSRANADPNYGIGTPEQQKLQEQQLADSLRDRTGAQGSGGTGYEADTIRKGITDFRIGMLAKRQQYLDNLRSAMVTSSQPGNQVQPADVQTGIGRSAVGNFAGTLAQRGGNAAANEMFGVDPNATQANQSGGAPGTNGFRPNGGMKVT